MAFESIQSIPKEEALMDFVISEQTRIFTQKYTKTTSRDRVKRRKEATRLSVIGATEALADRIEQNISSFPVFDELSPLYQKLISIVIDVDDWKRNLGALKWLEKRAFAVQKECTKKINRAGSEEQIKGFLHAFRGRVKSLIAQITPQLETLEEQRREFRKLPTIKEKYFTVVIYGFPNVGKTTLLQKLTGVNAEIAPYPFTTKGINLGYALFADSKVQFVDTPGTLARSDRQNKYERMAQVVFTHAAQAIIYVVDPTESTPEKEQMRLWKLIPKSLPYITYVSKKDITAKKNWQTWKESFMPAGDLEDIKKFIEKHAYQNQINIEKSI